MASFSYSVHSEAAAWLEVFMGAALFSALLVADAPFLTGAAFVAKAFAEAFFAAGPLIPDLPDEDFPREDFPGEDFPAEAFPGNALAVAALVVAFFGGRVFVAGRTVSSAGAFAFFGPAVSC
jgi:hypothetical protein